LKNFEDVSGDVVAAENGIGLAGKERKETEDNIDQS
jgi:hypothetical protein